MKPVGLKNAQRDITISRDEHGVPHVQAATWADAVYGLGYMHATDRGTQMLFSRSVASGTAAEEIADSPELVETDRFFRRIGLYRQLDRETALLEPSVREQLQAYCSGVNDGIAGSGRSLAVWATGFPVSPWDEAAILLVGQLLSFGGLAISQMQNERMLVELIHAGVNEDGLKELFSPRLDNVDFELLRQVKMASQLSDEALELLTDLPRLAGSNAWAVAPHRSASGAALLASDPHLEVNRLPSIWYEAVLRFDSGKYLSGATLPGCPLYAVARTNQLAWGVTYMKGDTVDYFVEDCRQSETGAWQYRRGQQWQDFEVREEIIARKGAEPDTLLVYENDQGTLEGDPGEKGAGLHLSIAWSGNFEGSGRAIGSWLQVPAASNARQAMDVVSQCTQPTLCWVFADTAGHIGLQSCGRFPLRGNGYSGLTPIPAWDEANHWQGWLDPQLLPSVYDPDCGYISTANEEMNPDNGPLLVTQLLPCYRKRRIDERLSVLPQATLDDMKSIQYDTVSLQARDLLDILLPHLPGGELRDLLANWDCSYVPSSREAALFQRLYRNVMVELFGYDEGIGWRRMLYLASRTGFSSTIIAVMDRCLAKIQSVWWATRDKSQMIRKAAQRVDMTTGETWAELNNFHFTDRFFGSHQVGRILGFNSRQYPMAGNHATPFQGHVLQTATRESTFAPSYHFVVDLGTNEAHTNLPGGPSESRFSRYYNIDVQRWFNGEYKVLHGVVK